MTSAMQGERGGFSVGFDPIAYINEPRWRQVRPGLSRIAELLDRMGSPHERLRFVHVAGTNGKGSTCAYLASILQAAGYRTGLFTSPYIVEFEERIRVDGENISPGELREATLFVREHAQAMVEDGLEHPTEFELMCAVAFEHFARSACDIVVCEVGLGGRLDATNVIPAPEACAITRIGLDHTDLLGDTPAQVAAEKAGIVKPGCPVVCYPQDFPEADRVIREAAVERGCLLVEPDFSQLAVDPVRPVQEGDGGDAPNMALVRPFAFDGLQLRTRLLGSYQPYNAALAVQTVRVLRERGWKLTDAAIVQGVGDTAWPGRFEVVQGSGCAAVVLDGGHNPQGAEALAASLADVFPGRRVVFVMSVLVDKDYRSMIRTAAPLGAAWVCVTSPNAPRALSAEDLAAAVREQLAAVTGETTPTSRKKAVVPVETAPDFASALARAEHLAGPQGVVCAWGSLYSLAGFTRVAQEGGGAK